MNLFLYFIFFVSISKNLFFVLLIYLLNDFVNKYRTWIFRFIFLREYYYDFFALFFISDKIYCNIDT